ncbi:PAS domain S-box protein [Pedobacter sp. KLB.chiD]|uniref:PAS domain S-box protein n=1 Tax=Pedobacter sp. KLB.chiD TaxID=3387402 RepID=UPI003999A231
MSNAVLFGLRQILSEILHLSGFNQSSPDICFALSVLLQKKTGRKISETTLKRLFGFAKYNFRTSRYTLDTLASYCGFENWSLWQEHVRQEQQGHHLSLGEQSSPFSKLFYYSFDPMWVFQISTLSFLEVNDAACKIYGYSRSEFLNMTIVDIRPEEDYALLVQTLNSAGEFCIHSPFRHILSNGEVIMVDLRSYEIRWNGVSARLVTAFPLNGTGYSAKILK